MWVEAVIIGLSVFVIVCVRLKSGMTRTDHVITYHAKDEQDAQNYAGRW